jgi:NCAIR mutase (PurE)-related protein
MPGSLENAANLRSEGDKNLFNSCSAGVAVVNIDNGFGAGCIASTINRL